MECAGRALSFWAYQSTQEMYFVYQRHASASLTVSQYIPGVLSEERDGQMWSFEHTDG
jgi:hypothetical protein